MSMTPSEWHHHAVVVEKFMDEETGAIDYEKAYFDLSQKYDQTKESLSATIEAQGNLMVMIENLEKERDELSDALIHQGHTLRSISESANRLYSELKTFKEKYNKDFGGEK